MAVVDWFTVDGDGPWPILGRPAARYRREVLPSRSTFPGAPHPRWWQIEDHALDIGGFPPDRSHLGTMLLHDVAVAHTDDWFWFPSHGLTRSHYLTTSPTTRRRAVSW